MILSTKFPTYTNPKFKVTLLNSLAFPPEAFELQKQVEDSHENCYKVVRHQVVQADFCLPHRSPPVHSCE